MVGAALGRGPQVGVGNIDLAALELERSGDTVADLQRPGCVVAAVAVQVDEARCQDEAGDVDLGAAAELPHHRRRPRH